MENELLSLRQEINAVDESLLPLILKRMEISNRIGSYKKQMSIPVLDENRENEILDKIAVRSGAEWAPYARAIYQKIMEMSRLYQQRQREEKRTE